MNQFNETKTRGIEMKNGKLNGKVAVVTGASKGIGAGIAKQLATEGAAVVVNYASSNSDADKVVDEIAKRGGKAVAVQGSVTKKADVENLFSAAEKAFDKGEFRESLEAQTPLGRIGQPDDIAPAAVFFASDDSKWITGETLLIAGGLR